MRKKELSLIITFATTTDAMRMEKYCKEQNLPGRLIPVPREITAGCGLAWKAACAEKDRLLAAMMQAALAWEQMAEIEV